MESTRLQELLDLYFDKSATTDEQAELEQLLLSSESARERFWRHAEDTWLIRRAVEITASEAVVKQPTNDALAPGSSQSTAAKSPVSRVVSPVLGFFARRTPLSMSVAALVIVALLGGMYFMAAPFYRAMLRDGKTGASSAHQFVAQLTDDHEAMWAAGQIGTVQGAHLVVGHPMDLQQGLAEVTFVSGAQIVIEGPARVLTDGPNHCTVESGKIVGLVPAAAVGFSVTTPYCEVVDLGTEFGISVTPGRAGVKVFEGSVAVVSPSQQSTNDKRRVIVAGEGAVFDKSGLVLQAKQPDALAFRRQIPAKPQMVNVTPEFVGRKNCSRLMYAGVGRAIEVPTLHNYDAATGGRAGNQYVWLDLSASLPELPPEGIERVLLRWEGVALPSVAHSRKPCVQTEVGIFSVPDNRRGIPTVFARGKGHDNVNFYATHASEVIDAVTIPSASEKFRFLANWDITKLVRRWIDNPAAPRRGQIIIINRQHPVWIQWDETPRVYVQLRSDEEPQGDAKPAGDGSKPSGQADARDDSQHGLSHR